MKALTIWQPWASLIMIGAKPWEWRGWRLPAYMIDRCVVIHASARLMREREIHELYNDVFSAGDSESSLVAEIAAPFIDELSRAYFKNQKPSLPLGAGLGTAILRKPAAFRSGGKAMTVATARDRLQAQLDLLRAANPVLSTNVELRLDGLPRSNRPEPSDVGIAVYFSLKGKQLCMPCDKWLTVADNITAVAQHIDALRRIERYGVQSVEEAFSGFAALPPMTWRNILTVAPNATFADVERAYRELAKIHHPDNGGSPAKMAEINAARDAARKEFGV